jgi:hypothetical protein
MSAKAKRAARMRAAKTARIAPRNLGVRPFLDDLREMERICAGDGGERVTTLARGLIKEALRARRISHLTEAGKTAQTANGAAPSEELLRRLRAAEEEVKRTRSQLADLAALAETSGRHLRALYALAVQLVGYGVTIEGEARLTLERTLLRTPGEEVGEALARLDEASRRKADELIRSVLRGQGLMS